MIINSTKLQAISDDLIAGKEVEHVSVRTFLSWFGVERRGQWVAHSIRFHLKEKGLETFPDFESTYIDSLIQIRLVKKEKPNIKKEEEPELEDLYNFDDPTYRISKLEAANQKLIYVKPDSSLQEAITKMLTHDFSQLPVMQNENRNLKGVVTWRSIGSNLALNKNSNLVKDLMDKNYPLISSETSLFKAIPTIIEYDYVLIKNSENIICGIVTACDLSSQFQQLTEPFLLVGEIENHLRQALSKLNKTDYEALIDTSGDAERNIESISDLTFGEYIRLFENKEIWEKLSISIDRKTFCEYLDKVRLIRNATMHFDPDGLENSQVDELRNFVRLLQSLRNLKII